MKVLDILLIHRDLPPDSYTGVAVQVHRLATALTKLGHRVTVRTISKKPHNAIYNVETISIPTKHIFLTSNITCFLKRLIIPYLFRTKSTEPYDIIHIHGDGGFVKYRKNYVRTFHGSARAELQYSKTIKAVLAQLISYFFEKYENDKIQNHACAVSVSQHSKRYLDSISFYIPNMVEIPTPPRAHLHKSEKPSIFFIGSINSRKRGELALKIYLELQQRIPDLLFTYISKTLFRDKKYFNKYNVKNAPPPVFCENISGGDMLGLAQKSWIFLSLSTYEGFGVGLVEAMCTATVPVSTPNPGSREIISSGINGILADDTQMVDNLSHLLTNSHYRNTLAVKAQSDASIYQPNHVAQTYVELYNRLI